MKKKQQYKRIDRTCCLCGEDDYELLDAHRIIPGSEGGKYTRHNTITVCAKCHRKIHADRIIILGKHFTSKGCYVLIYKEDNEEKIATC